MEQKSPPNTRTPSDYYRQIHPFLEEEAMHIRLKWKRFRIPSLKSTYMANLHQALRPTQK